MASGPMCRTKQAGHMAAPTSVAEAQKTLANGGPSTQGRFDAFAKPSANDRYLRCCCARQQPQAVAGQAHDWILTLDCFGEFAGLSN